jgi:outer membrane immunogenic protein
MDAAVARRQWSRGLEPPPIAEIRTHGEKQRHQHPAGLPTILFVWAATYLPQIALMVAYNLWKLKNTGWYRGRTIMSRILAAVSSAAFMVISGSALAADLSIYSPVPMVDQEVPFNWTRHYVGGLVGYGWGSKFAFETEDPEDGGSYSVGGIFAGVEAGANWQFGQHVLGIEGDVSWSGIKGDGLIDNDDPISTDIGMLATLTGRLGIARDRLLLYVEGGAALAGETHTFSDDGFSDTVSKHRFGGVLGAGVEYAFTNNWSAKLEYNYIHFGSKTHEFEVDGTEEIQIDQNMHTLKVGVNYLF